MSNSQDPQGPPAYGVAPVPHGSQGYFSGAPDHPQAQVVLILGIVGVFVPVVSFVAWVLGGKAKKEIRAGAPYAWAGSLRIGYILGVAISIISVLFAGFMLLVLVGIGIISF